MFSHIKELFTRPSGYSISRSVRLRSSASAYFNRTLTTPTNNKIWTWSAWVKRGILGTIAGRTLFRAGASSPSNGIRFEATTDVLRIFFNDASSGDLVTTQVFRDPASWYHIIVAVDTTQSTSTNRVKLYINGAQITAFSTASYPAQNYDPQINSAILHTIGAFNASGTPTEFFDGYLTEINFIDGQALTPSSFGETDSITGVWKAKKYGGTYGTNGFYLNFSDNSNNTATTIGKDYSGNGNNWTPNNVQTYDSVPDTPSNNFCVMNPLYNGGSGTSWSNGNLTSTIAVSQSGITASTFGISSGKWYWEVCASPSSPPSLCVGIIKTSFTPIGDVFLGYQSEGYGYYSYDGRKVNNSSFSTYGSSWEGAQYVIGIALDMDAGTITFYRNNVSQGTAFSSLSGTFTFAASDGGATAGTTFYVNFGADSSFAGQKTAQTNKDTNGLGNFFYAVPSGYLALCTQNLPDSTIKNGAAYMAATTYTGNGSTQTVSNGNFQPDFIWIKNRAAAVNHQLQNSNAGWQYGLNSNTTSAEFTDVNAITGTTSTGWSMNNNYNSHNQSGVSYVGWQWKAGGTSSSNTSGSITSTVSVGATQGFSVVTYTGTGANATVGHGLGVAPSMIILKSRVSATNWVVYHANLTSAAYVIQLNLTNAQSSSPTIFNSTAPTSSVFSIGTSSASNDTSMVAYCFAAVKGFSAFGSYTGNGSADGPFTYLGFRPRWIMWKLSSTTGDWQIWDSSRDTYNVVGNLLDANLSNAEATGQSAVDFLSNGFKNRSASVGNASGQTYIYAAFAENPFRNALAR